MVFEPRGGPGVSALGLFLFNNLNLEKDERVLSSHSLFIVYVRTLSVLQESNAVSTQICSNMNIFDLVHSRVQACIVPARAFAKWYVGVHSCDGCLSFVETPLAAAGLVGKSSFVNRLCVFCLIRPAPFRAEYGAGPTVKERPTAQCTGSTVRVLAPTFCRRLQARSRGY